MGSAQIVIGELGKPHGCGVVRFVHLSCVSDHDVQKIRTYRLRVDVFPVFRSLAKVLRGEKRVYIQECQVIEMVQAATPNYSDKNCRNSV